MKRVTGESVGAWGLVMERGSNSSNRVMYAPSSACDLGARDSGRRSDATHEKNSLQPVFPTGRMVNAKARALAAFVDTELHKHLR